MSGETVSTVAAQSAVTASRRVDTGVLLRTAGSFGWSRGAVLPSLTRLRRRSVPIRRCAHPPMWWDGTVSDDATTPFLIDAGGDAGTDPRAFASGAADLEAAGYDGIFAAETKHDPFVSL